MTALIVSLLLATLVGLTLRLRDGRFRDTGPRPDLDPELPVVGARATLVQLSAEQCAVCPRVARVLTEVASRSPGVAHVELRAEDHPGLLSRYDVRRSPTVLLVDATGQVRARTSGAVTPAQAEAALAALLGTPSLTTDPPKPETADVHAS